MDNQTAELSDNREKAKNVMNRLLQDVRTASLATADEDGAPLVSYVPVAVDGCERFLFFPSDLSQHTPNLKGRGRASLMLIEDESKTEHLFARHRAIFTGRVELIGRNDGDWETASQIYGNRFGKFFEMLTGLKDFHMFALYPGDIRIVIGFGAAFKVTGANWEDYSLLGSGPGER